VEWILTIYSNIDRLLDMWQANNPDSWFSTPGSRIPKWEKTGLRPFRQRNGEYHDSSTVQDTRSLGYAYPELKRWLPEYQTNGRFDPKKLRADLQVQIKAVYNASGAAVRKALFTDTRDESQSVAITTSSAFAQTDVPKVRAQITQAPQGLMSMMAAGPGDLPDLPDVLDMEDYVVNVRYERYDPSNKQPSLN
jgi:hypothetical protein